VKKININIGTSTFKEPLRTWSGHFNRWQTFRKLKLKHLMIIVRDMPGFCFVNMHIAKIDLTTPETSNLKQFKMESVEKQFHKIKIQLP